MFGLPAEILQYMPWIGALLFLFLAWSLAVILYEGVRHRRDPWLIWLSGMLLLVAAGAVGFFLALEPWNF